RCEPPPAGVGGDHGLDRHRVADRRALPRGRDLVVPVHAQPVDRRRHHRRPAQHRRRAHPGPAARPGPGQMTAADGSAGARPDLVAREDADSAGPSFAFATLATCPQGAVLTSPVEDTPIDRVTEAVRRLGDALLRTDRADPSLPGFADVLEAIADRIDDGASPVQQRLVDMWAGE